MILYFLLKCLQQLWFATQHFTFFSKHTENQQSKNLADIFLHSWNIKIEAPHWTKANFLFTRFEKKKISSLRRWLSFCSNTKVSLTFSALCWLLILVTLPRAAHGTSQPVDIYKLIWMRVMAFYKRKHLHASLYRVLFLLSITHGRVITLNKHQSTFTVRDKVISLILSQNGSTALV